LKVPFDATQMQGPRTNFPRVPAAMIVNICTEAGPGCTYDVGPADRATYCLSNQTQAQQIGIQQPFDRCPLRFQMLEGRNE
jgi:hypothetical protein